MRRLTGRYDVDYQAIFIMMHDLFISFSSRDSLVAEAAKHYLEARSIRCWKAPESIRPGEIWEEAIANAIQSAKGMLLIWSKKSQDSKQVSRELTLAASQEKVIIPFRIEEVTPQGAFAYYLTNTHWLDALSEDLQGDLARLADQIETALLSLNAAPSLDRELDELNRKEVRLRRCLSTQEESLGSDHPQTINTVFKLANVLSQQGRQSEAIPLRRRELAWRSQHDGDTDPFTLQAINDLASDLRETGELEEAETMFRELLVSYQQVLEPQYLGHGKAIAGLAKTLEQAGQIEEAAAFFQQEIDHYLKRYDPDTDVIYIYLTNRARLNLACVLHKLGKHADADALRLLDQLETSMKEIGDPDDMDTALMDKAVAFRAEIEKA